MKLEVVYFFASILEGTEKNKKLSESLSNIKVNIKKDFKSSVKEWQYKKKMEKVIKKFSN